MLKNDKIEVRIINHNLNHYRNIGFNVEYGDKIIVDNHQLSSGSHYKVDCICDFCGNIKNMKFQDYYQITDGLKEKYYCKNCVIENKQKKTLMKLYGFDNVSKCKIFKDKKITTNLKNWGVENVFQSEEIKNRNIKTMFDKYGDYYTKTQEYRDKSESTRKKKNSKIFEDEEIDFKKYKRLVNSETYRSTKTLFENWNGLDFYDSENIEDNFKYDPARDGKYPTIDHKLSVFQGFKNKINPKIIGGIDNLCIKLKDPIIHQNINI